MLADHFQLQVVPLLALQEMKAEFPLDIAGGEIALGFHRLPGVYGAVEQPGFIVASQSPSYVPMLTRYAGKCEVVRVGPDIFSGVLTGVGFLRSEPGETAFGKAGEGETWRGKSNVRKNGESRKPQMAASCALQTGPYCQPNTRKR